MHSLDTPSFILTLFIELPCVSTMRTRARESLVIPVRLASDEGRRPAIVQPGPAVTGLSNSYDGFFDQLSRTGTWFVMFSLLVVLTRALVSTSFCAGRQTTAGDSTYDTSARFVRSHPLRTYPDRDCVVFALSVCTGPVNATIPF